MLDVKAKYVQGEETEWRRLGDEGKGLEGILRIRRIQRSFSRANDDPASPLSHCRCLYLQCFPLIPNTCIIKNNPRG